MNAALGGRGLALRGVSAVFRDAGGSEIQALRQVDASFAAGGLTVVTGPSGSGKSTLLHVLAGILRPAQGELRHGETVVSRLPETERDRWRLTHCGLVFQDFRLIDELDAIGNVLLPSQFGRLKAGSEGLRQRATDLLTRLDVPARSGPVVRLSRGEQQRVALARALLLDPPLILADEPTASLDADNGRRIAAELLALARQGRTVVAVSHDEKLVALADTVLTLKAGVLQAGLPLVGAQQPDLDSPGAQQPDVEPPGAHPPDIQQAAAQQPGPQRTAVQQARTERDAAP